MINQIKDDDIYLQLTNFPAPEHRSIKLSKQSPMIFVILFFAPSILHKERAKMREIADRHFSDNWIIPLYLGYLVDLTQYWGKFDAASKALENNMHPEDIKKLAKHHHDKLKSLKKDLKLYLKDGKLIEEYVLENVTRLLHCLTDTNVTIRWLMLHKTSRNKELKELINSNHTNEELVDLLLQLTKFEDELKILLRELVSTKNEAWTTDKAECEYYMDEISEYFAGNRNMGR